MRMLSGARLVWHMLVAVWKLLVFAPRWTDQQRAAEIADWSRNVFRLLDIELVIRNAPPRHSGGSLFAGNHVSWLDIHALLATADLQFIAKSEVRNWPVIGWLAQKLGTHFITRDRRGEAYTTAASMGDALAAGRAICIFPEGSTTDGLSLRPFRAALFEPAARGAARVRPFTIRYRDAEGQVSKAAAFIGDMSMFQSIAALLRQSRMRCEITFLPAIDTTGRDRRTLALAVQQAVAADLEIGINFIQPAVRTDQVRTADLALKLAHGCPLPPAAPYTCPVA